MVEKIGKDLVKVGVSQEDLEDSINGLSQLKPILQAQLIKSNGANKRQAAIDVKELGRHFDTAIFVSAILRQSHNIDACQSLLLWQKEKTVYAVFSYRNY